MTVVRRREFLAVGGSALVAWLSGCLGSVGLPGRSAGPPEVREESGEPPARMQPAIPELHADSTHATLAVGEGGTQNEQVWVWNETGGSREVAIAIGPGSDAEPWFREQYDLAGDANLAIDLREARDYSISVRADEWAETVEFPDDWFDCNDTITDVVVRSSEIESRRISTQEGCGGGLL